MNRNKGILREGCSVKVNYCDTSGCVVWSYKATYENGWFNHKDPKNNARHDTPAHCDGCYTFYEVQGDTVLSDEFIKAYTNS